MPATCLRLRLRSPVRLSTALPIKSLCGVPFPAVHPSSAEHQVVDTLHSMFPDSRGPDVCIECAGQQYAQSLLHRAEMALNLETDTPEVCCPAAVLLATLAAPMAFCQGSRSAAGPRRHASDPPGQLTETERTHTQRIPTLIKQIINQARLWADGGTEG